MWAACVVDVDVDVAAVVVAAAAAAAVVVVSTVVDISNGVRGSIGCYSRRLEGITPRPYRKLIRTSGGCSCLLTLD